MVKPLGEILGNLIKARAARHVPAGEEKFINKHKVKDNDDRLGKKFGTEPGSDSKLYAASNIKPSKTAANPDVEVAESGECAKTMKDKSAYKRLLKTGKFRPNKLKEDVLRELSKGTLGNYVLKAAGERASLVHKAAKGQYGRKEEKKHLNRIRGMGNAVEKLTREATREEKVAFLTELFGKGKVGEIKKYHDVKKAESTTNALKAKTGLGKAKAEHRAKKHGWVSRRAEHIQNRIDDKKAWQAKDSVHRINSKLSKGYSQKHFGDRPFRESEEVLDELFGKGKAGAISRHHDDAWLALYRKRKDKKTVKAQNNVSDKEKEHRHLRSRSMAILDRISMKKRHKEELDKNTETRKTWRAGNVERAAKRRAANEEFLMELSKKTLGSYARKATDDLDSHAATRAATYPSSSPGARDKWEEHLRKSRNRRIGIKRVVSKLTKEEVLAELSKQLLGRYVNRSAASMYDIGTSGKKGNLLKAVKRLSGVTRATKRLTKGYGAGGALTKEEIISELSSALLRRYRSSANKDCTKKEREREGDNFALHMASDKKTKGELKAKSDKTGHKLLGRYKGLAKAKDKIVAGQSSAKDWRAIVPASKGKK